MDQPGKVANPARGQLNRENNIPLSPCVPDNLVSLDGFSRPIPRQYVVKLNSYYTSKQRVLMFMHAFQIFFIQRGTGHPHRAGGAPEGTADVDGTGAGYGLRSSCGVGHAVRGWRLHSLAVAAGVR